jgi:DNA (cytosine-5)-methyltransferase 1
MSAYYNEIDPYAAEWLRNLIKAGHIADGEVDTRSIVDVSPDDLRHFTQCHFFAGIAGWSHALRLAGWSDERKIWTGSCPCQPFSVAGKGKGTDDERHLWPHFFRLIRSCRPPVVMGEQVAGTAGYGWLDGVRSDLESENYSIKGVDIPACSANAPHIRQRLYWVATRNVEDARCGEQQEPSNTKQMFVERNGEERTTDTIGGSSSFVVRSDDTISKHMADTKCRGRESGSISTTDTATELIAQDSWGNAIWLNGADGKTRRAQPDICLLAHGVPARVGKLRAYGNAIVPPLAAEVIKSVLECDK